MFGAVSLVQGADIPVDVVGRILVLTPDSSVSSFLLLPLLGSSLPLYCSSFFLLLAGFVLG